MTCNHRHISGFHAYGSGAPAPLWRCTDCGMRFHPADEVARIVATTRPDDARAEAELKRLRGIARASGRETGR